MFPSDHLLHFPHPIFCPGGLSQMSYWGKEGVFITMPSQPWEALLFQGCKVSPAKRNECLLSPAFCNELPYSLALWKKRTSCHVFPPAPTLQCPDPCWSQPGGMPTARILPAAQVSNGPAHPLSAPSHRENLRYAAAPFSTEPPPWEKESEAKWSRSQESPFVLFFFSFLPVSEIHNAFQRECFQHGHCQ